MILYLMRRDLPEPMALIACAFVTFTIFGDPQIGLLVGAPFLFIGWTAVAHRASAFEATMPIRGRDIMAARVLWQLAILAPPLAACLFASLAGKANALAVNRVLDAALIAALAVFLPYAIRAEEIGDPPFLITAAAWTVLAAASAGILYFLPPDLALDALLVAAVVVARIIWMKSPDAFETAPRKAAIERPSKVVLRTAKEQASPPSAWRLIARSIFAGSGDSTLTLIAFYVLAFGYGTFGPGRAQPYMLLYFTVPLVRLRRDTAWLAAFPISSRARLWILLVPSLVMGLGFFTLGRIVSPLFRHVDDPMTVWAPAASPALNSAPLPFELWRREDGGAGTKITSPWGETTFADTLTKFHESFYNPYSTNGTSSVRFAEWQFGRATNELFGEPIESGNYKRRMFAGQLPPTVLESARMRVLIAAAMLSVVLLFLAYGETSYSHRKVVRNQWWKVFHGIVLISVVACMFGDIFYSPRGMAGTLAPSILRLLLRVSRALPANVFVLAVIAVLPVLVSYALLEWQFARSELSQARISKPKWARVLTRPIPYSH